MPPDPPRKATKTFLAAARLHKFLKPAWPPHSTDRSAVPEKCVKRAASDIEEDGNLSVEEILTENQEERLKK